MPNLFPFNDEMRKIIRTNSNSNHTEADSVEMQSEPNKVNDANASSDKTTTGDFLNYDDHPMKSFDGDNQNGKVETAPYSGNEIEKEEENMSMGGTPGLIPSEAVIRNEQGTSTGIVGSGSRQVGPDESEYFSVYGDCETVGDQERDKSCWSRTSRRNVVAISLRNNWQTQRMFLSKIVLVKALQAFIVLLWTYLAIHTMGEALATHLHGVTIFVMVFACTLKILIIKGKDNCTKTELKKDSGYIAWITVTMILEAVLIGTICAAFSVRYDAKFLVMAIWIILFSQIIISVLPHVTKIVVMRWTTAAIQFTTVLLISLFFVAFKTVDINKSYTQFFLLSWFPAFLIAEAVILISYCLFRRVLAGKFCDVHEMDWMYIACCI